MLKLQNIKKALEIRSFLMMLIMSLNQEFIF